MRVFVLMLMTIAVSARAGGYLACVASDREIALLKAAKMERMRKSKPLEERMIAKNPAIALRFELSQSQLVAEALTNTLAREYLGPVSGFGASGQGALKRDRRIGNIHIEYSAEMAKGGLVHEICSLRLLDESGRVSVSWKTIDFKLAPFEVKIDEIRSVLEEMEKAGIKVENISVIVNSKKKFNDCVSLMRNLGIIKQSLVGVDEYAKRAKMRIELSKRQGRE